MLRLYLGRAGSGRTSYILSVLGEMAERGEGGNILIVPEQYSHDCERALAALGDRVCLYAQALSFTRLAVRVSAQTGGMARPALDAGGRTLAMSRAFMAVSSRLKVYDVGGRRPDFIRALLAAYDELKSAGAGADAMSAASERLGGTLGRKLSDLALIFEAFEAVKETAGLDMRDRLERLAEDIGKSDIGLTGRVFVDGFTDFTGQELRILGELMRKGADVTVTLTCPDIGERDLLFLPGVRTANALLHRARELGVPTEIRRFEEVPGRDPALRYLERNLFNYAAPGFGGDASAVSVIHAGAMSEECAAAAARVLELVRNGTRFRDIAVVSPQWPAYAPILACVFDSYGIPAARTEMSDILEKPVMAHLTAALDSIGSNWDYVNMFRYLKTGLVEIAPEDRDLLENYVLKWNIRGEGMWSRPWVMAPEGYSDGVSEGQRELLERINAVRERVARPLTALSGKLAAAGSAVEKVRAVYEFMEETELYGILEEKAQALSLAGRAELAGEYRQLWDIIVGALEQFAAILGDAAIGTEEFVRLLKLVLGQYKVGVIPSSVDSVRAGDMARIRARGVRHLIVLGATDDALPARSEDGGLFTDRERERLCEQGIETLDDREMKLARELAGVYAALTVPTDSLTLTYPEPARGSYILTRLERLFGTAQTRPGEEIFTAAPGPCFELAAFDGGETAGRARSWFEEKEEWRGKLSAVERAANAPRGQLSRQVARELYGGKMRLSASKIDKYYSCRYAYFLQYGLGARPRDEAALDAPEAGTFMHFVLERTARQVKSMGGFRAVTEADVRRMAAGFAQEYADGRLGGLENKSGRFRYLFGRLTRAAQQVAVTMYQDLRESDFTPMDFELRFAPDGELPPVETGEGDTVVGAVDRVDGWVKDGKLYLRVVDYKTGKKTMDLRDVINGVGLQMLIYLFALEREGARRYGMEIVPAGVLYSPARDELARSDRDLEGEELEKARQKLVRYSGLILADAEVMEAMEHGSRKRLPVTVSSRTGEVRGGIADAEQLGKLSRVVDRLIDEMSREIRAGSITANPYLRGRVESACAFCKFHDACRFTDGRGGESFRRASSIRTADIWKKIEEAGR